MPRNTRERKCGHSISPAYLTKDTFARNTNKCLSLLPVWKILPDSGDLRHATALPQLCAKHRLHLSNSQLAYRLQNQVTNTKETLTPDCKQYRAALITPRVEWLKCKFLHPLPVCFSGVARIGYGGLCDDRVQGHSICLLALCIGGCWGWGTSDFS